MKKKVLIFAPFFTPSVKGGGPIVSTKNLVENLSSDLDFYICTSDRDLGDSKPFSNINNDIWMNVGNAKVRYLNRKDLNLAKVIEIMKLEEFDHFYLNSFFDFHFSILPVIAKRISNRIKGTIVLAPRGEFSPGALSLKATKKRLYINFFKNLGFSKSISWHATADTEKNHIEKIMGNQTRIKVASNLTANYSHLDYSKKLIKNSNECKFIFISRIHPMKNLLGALTYLKNVKGNVLFSIYGPIEDDEYWTECQMYIKKLPSNVKVVYKGILKHFEIFEKFQENHFFLLPTYGENFGHVISEALVGGCPVIISDQTPWLQLEEKNVGWDIALGEKDRFISAINEAIKMSNEDYQIISHKAFEYGKEKSTNKDSIMKTLSLFEI
ncbi:glycosyltransferase [Jeotgalibaca arthritidis]|uniref:Glycosyltransferase n=1 Tax=Jeotgalibaca arthritidis TaxID=1868794 RepID=A0A6G7KB30_9LACT|nr:glycosyltransferase [Jeotgalibaca arthritidis]QII82447.1 glycosyltransferase [Jeotgalibaca arthritidis]